MTVATQNVFRFADFEVRELEFCATRSGQPLAIEPKAFRVLLYLLHHAGHLVSKEELFKIVWGYTAVTDNSLTRAIALLRHVLEDDPHQPHFIETVATAGYRFIFPVEVENGLAEPVAVGATREEATHEADPSQNVVRPPASAVKWTRGRWLIVTGIALLAATCAAFWYFPRPLPQPRVTYKKLTQNGHDKILAGTDGSRIYYTDGSHFSIHQIAIGGGDPGPVTSATHLGLAGAWDVSRDGSRLLIGQRELGLMPWEMWIVSTVGETERHLGAGLTGAFSPDGQSVVYSTRLNELWTVRSDGSGAHKLADTPGTPRHLAWRPDGSVIRFTINSRYWEIGADGSNLHEWLRGWKPSFDQCCGRWTFDGGSFIFLAGERVNPGVARPIGAQIWMLDERRGFIGKPAPEPVQLTTGPIGWDSPIPSRDGKTIFAEGRARLGELVRVDPQSRQVQPFLNGISVEFISFSADGKSIAYVTFPDGIAWKADADGSHPVQLSGPSEYAINPVWSPDGSEILFTGLIRYQTQVHMVSADGRNSRVLMANAAEPRWSPDGSRVVMDLNTTGTMKRHVVIMELATNTTSDIPQSDGLAGPRWSPDGRYVAALSVVPPCLRVFDFQTQQWTTVPLDGDITFTAWSRDGRYIYGLDFDTVRGDRWVFRFPVNGGKPERILDLNDWKLTGWCGFSMTLDPSDAPLILRETGSSEIYAIAVERE